MASLLTRLMPGLAWMAEGWAQLILLTGCLPVASPASWYQDSQISSLAAQGSENSDPMTKVDASWPLISSLRSPRASLLS